MSYLVPASELTLSAIAQLRRAAINAGIERAINLGIDSRNKLVPKPDGSLFHPGLVVRPASPVADFGVGVGGWLTMTLAAVGTQYSMFASAVPAALNPTLAVRQIAIFYGVNVETATLPVHLLEFRQGAAAGTTKALFDLEILYGKQETDGYFTEPIVYDEQDILNIVVTARLATGAQARVSLKSFIIEPVKRTLS